MQSNNIKISVDLGCGMRKAVGNSSEWWYGVDIRPFKDVDFVLNIGKDKLPFEDDFVDFIRAIHLFEHLYPEELFFAVEECWRVLKPTGCLHVEVPKAGTNAYYIHPDHKIQFMKDTFGFFQVPGNEEHVDPNGYLKGFWHVEVLENGNPEAITVEMYPNKPGGKYPYVEVFTIDNVGSKINNKI